MKKCWQCGGRGTIPGDSHEPTPVPYRVPCPTCKEDSMTDSSKPMTPDSLPWATDGDIARAIRDRSGRRIDTFSGDGTGFIEDVEHAAYAAHACNNYPRLVEALVAAIYILTRDAPYTFEELPKYLPLKDSYQFSAGWREMAAREYVRAALQEAGEA